MRALIVDPGFSRGALAAVRALGAAGWVVGVASTSVTAAARSRSCKHRHWIPRPETSLDLFVAAIAAAAQQRDYDVVFACGDIEVRVLSCARDRIGAVTGYGTHTSVEHLLDKKRMETAARSVGVDVPRSYSSFAEALAAGVRRVVIKARSHWIVGGSEGPPRLEACVVEEESAARARIDELQARGVEPLIQEYVDGTLIGLPILMGDDGEVVARMQQVTKTTFPAAAGEVTRVTTVGVDEDLCRRLVTLLRSLGWTGLAQSQLVSGIEGTFLIDVNGRFYASMGLALRAGVNLADAWARVATGRPVTAPEAKTGVRYQWLEGDVRRALEDRAPSQELIESLRWSLGAVHATWSATDPLPAIQNAIHVGQRSIRKLRRSFSQRELR